MKEVAFKKIKSGLFEIKRNAYLGLVVYFFWSLFLGGFMLNHLLEMRFFLPAQLLLGFSIVGFVISVYRLKLYLSISTRYSVLQTQRKIERLNQLQLLDIQSLLIVIPLFSVPFAIVMAKALLNLDLFTFAIFVKLALYATVGGLIVAVIMVFILTKFPNKNLKASIDFLNELKETE